MFWITVWCFFMFACMMIFWKQSWFIGLILGLLLTTCTPEPIVRLVS